MGRIDFIHRTFQDFLTAEEAADQGDIGLLIQNAHLDPWRDVVVMAAGLANAPLRQELFEGLLGRADTEPRLRRKLHLLAAAAMESAPALTTTIAERIERAMGELVPPRRLLEANSLAAAGEVLLPRLLRLPSQLSESATAAIVRTAALINGPEVWPVLERLSQDPRRRVQEELVAVWRYFDPDEYAARVLADAPLIDGQVRIDDQALLPAVTRLRNLSDLYLDLSDVTDLEFLIGLPCLSNAQLSGGFDDLAPFARCADLESLLINPQNAVDPTPLVGMLNLKHLYFYSNDLTSLDFLRSMTRLVSLGLRGSDALQDLSPIGYMHSLTSMALYNYLEGTDLGFIENLAKLRELDLGRSSGGGPLGIRGGIRQLVTIVPALHELGFLFVSPLEELDQLTHFSGLEKLSIRRCDVADLTPLANVTSLRTLQISALVAPKHLEEIRRLTQLTHLQILSSPGDPRDIDLSGLGDAQLTVSAYRSRHRFVGAGKRIKVQWIGQY